MTLYKRWPKEISIFFSESVMRTRHPGGNGNFLPGKILAWEKITISSRVTNAHDDFTEKRVKNCILKLYSFIFIYFRSLSTVNATQLVDITVLAMSRQENVCALLDTLEIHVKKES